MSEIIFNFKGVQNIIQCQHDSKLKDICNNYATKIKHKNLTGIVFLYNGNQIKGDLSFIEQANQFDKERNKMTILVSEINNEVPEEENETENSIKYSNEILCPECGEPVKIKFENYKVKLFQCKNGHERKIWTLSECKNLITKDESKIICDLCKDAKKSQTYNNIFYYCYTWNQKFCPICKSRHEKDNTHTQKIIDYDLKTIIAKNIMNNMIHIAINVKKIFILNV